MVELTSEYILVSLDPDWTVSGQGPAATIEAAIKRSVVSPAATIGAAKRGQWSVQLLPLRLL